MDEEKLKQEQEKFELEKKSLKKQILQGNLKLAIIGIFIVFEILFFAGILFKNDLIELQSDKKMIGVINFDKEITTKTVNETIKILDKASHNKQIQEILFIMNSPGGSPSASEELSEYLKEVNKTKKITMYVESIAASGGYYIASAIKPLRANKNAIIGSIGVIIQHYNVGKLSKTIGVEEDNIAYGEFKQPISFFKPVDKKSKKYLEDHLLRPMYNNFLDSVADNRGIEKEKIAALADGQVFLANDSRIKDVLVDEITSLYKVKHLYTAVYGKDILFKDLKPKKQSLFGNSLKGKLDVNLNNLNSNFSTFIK